jgi:hypothetical protein
MTDEEFKQMLAQNYAEPTRIRNLANPAAVPYSDFQVPTSNVAPSSFASNLGGLLFGGADSGLNEYLSREQQKQMQSQALMSAAMSLLRSGRTTTTPIGLGEALGSAYEAGTAGYQGAQENAIKQMLTKQKLDEFKTQKQMQADVRQYMGQKPPAGMSANEFKAQQYMNLADLYAATNPDQASKFFDMAQKLMPKVKVTGQPFEVVDESGKPVMIQQFEDGEIRTLSGFGPKREVVLQNVDGRIVAIDKSKLVGGETYGTGITPAEQQRLEMEAKRLGMDVERLKLERQRVDMEARRLNLSEADFKRGQYERVENEDGVFYVPKVPGLPAIPVTGPGGVLLKGKAPPKPTEGEANAAGFANQMENAEAVISQLPVGSQPGAGSGVAGSIPFVGDVTKRLVQPAATQQYEQAAQAWIRAKLRKESGAAIGVDEMAKEYQTYFPQINDSDAVIAQKARARQIATEAMKKSAGKSYTPTAMPSPVVSTPPVIQNILNKYPPRTQ